ncbi:MAG: phenylalanine--tRNA ligase beta subunit-related protein [Candidatus Thermoplasmatota archaeon]|nr:phenylalanine--tRNA ligase beta subunit-related protein [Candidatus Thermoplasmatota archaeon]
MKIELEEGPKTKGIFLETGILEDITVKVTRPEVFNILARELKQEMRSRFRSLDDVKGDRTARALRDFFWRVGIDPTKTRPSSEALLRRLLKKELPRINNLVDAGNLASTRTLIPVGIYDLDRIEGKLTLRESSRGEGFRGIGGKDMELDDGIPVLSDEKGVIHIYPHRDCVRTMVTENCRNALIMTCGVPGMKIKLTEWALDEVMHYWNQVKE